jgi:rfaE bifunctional protein nucleotidyltransferase chain/domain
VNLNFEEVVQRKIHRPATLIKQRAIWKLTGQRVVFTNGVFDILHRGHLEYLMQARSLGNALIVGVNSDASTRRLKGPERPVNTEQDRLLMLASMAFVDAAILFEEDTPLEIISQLIPDILVKGGDYTPDQMVGSDVVLRHGGQVQSLRFVEGHSTTSIINRLKHG